MKPLADTGSINARRLLCGIGLASVVCLVVPALSTQAQEETPTEATEPDPQPQAPADDSQDEILASIQQQLEQLLSTQRYGSEQQVQAANRADNADLESIATRCEVLANNATDDTLRLNLLNLRARTLSELVRLQTGKEPAERGKDWMAQLRSVSEQMRSIEIEQAEPLGDYWLLLADTAQIARLDGPTTSRQAVTERLLVAYVAKHKENAAATEWVADARLSLAQLLDERGDQPGAARQLGALGELPEQSPRYEQTQPIRERIARIGMPVAFEGITTGTARWNIADHAGSPVLMHIYADPVEPSTRMIADIQNAIAGQTLGGFSIVSLRVGDALPNQSLPPWPVVPVDLEPGGVLDKLGIDALPTLIWLDEQGNLASIGNNIVVLKQQPKPAPADEDAGPDNDSQPDTQPPSDPQPEPQPEPES